MPFLSDADLFARLVGFDSTSHRSNLPIADFIASYLDQPGVRIHRNPNTDGTKTNLVIELGPACDETRRGLVLSAHMDVVPAGEGWTSDPFVLTDRGDRWLGRGTADMKGFLALAVNAFARTAGAARAAAEPLAAPLVLLLTYDEELGCLGARRLVETWPAGHLLPRSAVIGEPTEFAAVSLHKGHLKMGITLHGTSAHSGYPHLGHNAIEPMGRVIAALSALRAELAGERPRWSEHFPETPFVALNLGRITGGTAINVVPERCQLEIGLRTLPDLESAGLVARVERAVAGAIPGERYEVEVIGDGPPMRLDPRAEIYRALCAWNGQAESAAVSYATDAGWLQRLDLEGVICGPGTIEVAHKPDEHLPKADLARGRAMVEHLIERFCRKRS